LTGRPARAAAAANFGRFQPISRALLTVQATMLIVRRMNGLFAICGICPEIIG
jgi:hypothetical protein